MARSAYEGLLAEVFHAKTSPILISVSAAGRLQSRARMTTSITLITLMISLTGCHFSSSYDSYSSSYNSLGSSRSRTDEYGTYYYDR